MTKTETQALTNVRMYAVAGLRDTAARSLSALIRAARTNASKAELLAEARKLGVDKLPEFVV